jgi:hypothetical protein
MKTKASHLLLAGIAIAGISASVQSASPAQEKHRAAVDAVKANKAAAIERQPRTMTQADATTFRTRSGGTAVRVPTELWSTLHTQQRADGTVVLTESDGNTTTTRAEELPHE